MKLFKRIFIIVVVLNIIFALFAYGFYLLSKTKCPIGMWNSDVPFMQVYFCEGPSTTEKMTCEIMVAGEIVPFDAANYSGLVSDKPNRVEFGHYVKSESNPDVKEWVCELGLEYSFRGKNVIITIFSSEFENSYPIGMEITLTSREPKYNYTYY